MYKTMSRIYARIGDVEQLKRLDHDKISLKLKHFVLFVTEHDLVDRWVHLLAAILAHLHVLNTVCCNRKELTTLNGLMSASHG
jgi:hypothetical protein